MYMRNHGKFLAMSACKIDFINSTVFTKRKITETHILRTIIQPLESWAQLFKSGLALAKG